MNLINIEGFYLIDKPVGITSSDVTIQLKRHSIKKQDINKKHVKFGHSGTLDPAASGLLIIACGKATRFLQYLPQEKVYEFTVQFGMRTDTGDLAGSVIEIDESKVISKEEIINILTQFLGKTEQVPNKFSAIKIDGKRAYELARANLPVDMPAREIFIYNLELINFFENKAQFIVYCKSGLYVRTLAEDIAKKLGTIGVVTNLRRIASNGFSIQMIQNSYCNHLGIINSDSSKNIETNLENSKVKIAESAIERAIESDTENSKGNNIAGNAKNVSEKSVGNTQNLNIQGDSIDQFSFQINRHGVKQSIPLAFFHLNCLTRIYNTVQLNDELIHRLNQGQRLKTEHSDIDFALCINAIGLVQGGIKISGGIIFPLCMINI